MKLLFYFGALGLILFEIANVYFIMPMPGSQRMASIDLAYFLYTWRWGIRTLFGIMILIGFKKAFQGSKVFSILFLIGVAVVAYYTNFKMAADTIFYQPSHLELKNAKENKVGMERLVIGVAYKDQAKAYPIQYIGYHHQVCDSIADKPIIVTYCTVCRTGRIFEPIVNGKPETFRLVGMDHFNAMFEDKTTKSWWRQATGEAITGRLKGQYLPEMNSTQTTLREWLKLYPNSLIMQADPTFQEEYDSLSNYETGRRKGVLTHRDTVSWQEKSWIVGIALNKASKAYDWNMLQKQHIVNDLIDNQPIVLTLAADSTSVFAFHRTSSAQEFIIKNDTLSDGQNFYNLLGKSFDPAIPDLQRINASQEYWHSWRTFHPGTARY